jgi:drug/metabolite transporter (DMT)-like permease
MYWLSADLIMFTCSVGLYLSVRRASLLKLPSQSNNLAMFVVPFLVFAVASILTHAKLALSWWQFLQVLITAVILSYYGNAMSVRSIELAPNAGYSLVLSKSYVVLTSILAVPLFGAHLTAHALLAIGLIVACSAVILVNPKRTHKTRSAAWIPLAFGSFLCWAFLSLMAKHLISGGMPTITFLVYVFGIGTLCVLVEIWQRRIPLTSITPGLWTLLLVGVAASGFNFFNFYAVSIAPNVGYVNATNAASIGAVTILSPIFFKDELTKQKVAGVFGVITGLLLLLAWK